MTPDADSNFTKERRSLVNRLERQGRIRTKEVRDAMLAVPRHEFVMKNRMRDAYIDHPLPLFANQTISAPHMVAIMVEELKLNPGNKVLEIGAGSGYHAAVCAEIVREAGGHVYTIERIGELADFARDNIYRAGYSRIVTVLRGDGTLGLPEHAPFDRIFVAASGPEIPPPLIEQLSDNGILLAPIGNIRYHQELIRLRKTGRLFERETLGGVVFVPLIGEHGWSE